MLGSLFLYGSVGGFLFGLLAEHGNDGCQGSLLNVEEGQVVHRATLTGGQLLIALLGHLQALGGGEILSFCFARFALHGQIRLHFPDCFLCLSDLAVAAIFVHLDKLLCQVVYLHFETDRFFLPVMQLVLGSITSVGQGGAKLILVQVESDVHACASRSHLDGVVFSQPFQCLEPLDVLVELLFQLSVASAVAELALLCSVIGSIQLCGQGMPLSDIAARDKSKVHAGVIVVVTGKLLFAEKVTDDLVGVRHQFLKTGEELAAAVVPAIVIAHASLVTFAVLVHKVDDD